MYNKKKSLYIKVFFLLYLYVGVLQKIKKI